MSTNEQLEMKIHVARDMLSAISYRLDTIAYRVEELSSGIDQLNDEIAAIREKLNGV